jgi:hypothetical protein
MLNVVSRTQLLVGGWFTMLTAVALVCNAMAANLSTTVLVVALGVAPGVVVALLKAGAAPPTVAEILHSVHEDDRR